MQRLLNACEHGIDKPRDSPTLPSRGCVAVPAGRKIEKPPALACEKKLVVLFQIVAVLIVLFLIVWTWFSGSVIAGDFELVFVEDFNKTVGTPPTTDRHVEPAMSGFADLLVPSDYSGNVK